MSAYGPDCVKTRGDGQGGKIGLPGCAVLHSFTSRKGPKTPQIVLAKCFYTVWANSGHSGATDWQTFPMFLTGTLGQFRDSANKCPQKPVNRGSASMRKLHKGSDPLILVYGSHLGHEHEPADTQAVQL